ncbi:MAG: hypothetical protein DRQ39_09095 [Gammaproteobacteria bacterium]|nr:MAG: hypothetical protein DRQ39_09095 [Gammaproteobacteria bacterium]
MPRNDTYEADARLLIHELESVGLVGAGANGPSDILITKTAETDDGKKASAWQKFVATLTGKTAESETAEIVITNAEKALDDVKAAVEKALEGLDDEQVEEMLKARNVGEWFEANLHAAFTQMADGHFGEGFLNREERIALSSAIGEALDAFRKRLEDEEPGLYRRDPFDGPPADMEPAPPTVSRAMTNRPTKGDPMPEPITLTDEQRETLSDEAQAYVASLEAAVEEATKDDGASAEVTEEADVLKDASPAVIELLQKQQAEIDAAKTEAAEATATAKAEQDIRLNAEYVTKAETMPNIAKADDLGPLLRKIESALSDDEIELFLGFMTQANARIESGDLFTELGKGGFGTESLNSAEAQATAKAKEKATAKGITFEAAYSEVLKEDQDLNARIYAESRETAKGGK